VVAFCSWSSIGIWIFGEAIPVLGVVFLRLLRAQPVPDSRIDLQHLRFLHHLDGGRHRGRLLITEAGSRQQRKFRIVRRHHGIERICRKHGVVRQRGRRSGLAGWRRIRSRHERPCCMVGPSTRGRPDLSRCPSDVIDVDSIIKHTTSFRPSGLMPRCSRLFARLSRTKSFSFSA
jgi:hypothetical protein